MEKKSSNLIKDLVNINDEMMTTEDVANMLHISTAGVRKRIQRGSLLGHRNNRKWYIFKSELLGQIRDK